MAGYGSRANSDTFTAGDTIKAAHLNDEFDQLVAAFHETTGHKHDGSTDGDGAAITSLPANCTLPDDIKLIFGTDSDVFIQYDETTTDSLRIAAAEGAALAVTLAADEGDDAGDEWKLNIADGGVLTLGNDINSAGVYVNHLTLTPNATVANSTAAFAGNVTVAGDLTISGDDLTMGTNTSGHVLVADGSNFNPVAISGDVTIAANGAVTIANGAVENAMLADDAVGADELAANAVVTASIVDDNVTQAKIADDAVGADQLAANAVVDASVASSANIAVSKTALTAGTNISLSTNTLNVDDAFLINSGDDTTSGVITSAGYKLNVGAGSGDVTTQFQQGGTTLFTVGIDDSDSEKFKIHSSTALADTSDFEITSAGVVSLASDFNVGGNTVLTGNLTVNGSTTTVNTATLSVEDPLIILASGNDAADSVDIGFYGLYDTSGTDKYAGLFRDANDSGKFKLFKDLQVAPTTTVNTSGTGYAAGTLVANLEGNVTGNASGTAATVTEAAQSNITSLGTLTTLTVDSIIIDGTNIGHTSDTDAIGISSGGVVNFTQAPTVASAAIKTAGKETIYVPASAMYPTTTSGCAALTQVEISSGQPELKVLDFDPSSDENAQFSVAFPKSWNEGVITFRAFFTVTGTNTGTVKWELSGVSMGDNDAIGAGFGTAIGPTAKAHSGTSNDINITAESGNVTISNAAVDEMVFFNIHRDVSDDDQTGDARLIGIQIFYTTDAANDA